MTTKTKTPKTPKTPKADKAAAKAQAELHADKAASIEGATTEAPAGEPRVSRSIVRLHYKQKYGNRQNNGDEIAGELTAATTGNDKGRAFTDLALLTEVAEANGIDMAKYAHLNAGQQRMNVGNRLRGMVKRGEFVVIGKRKFNAENAKKKAA